MDHATRIPTPAAAATGRQARAKNLLDGVQMSAHDRRQAEHDMRRAEQLVDFIFAVTDGWQGLVRRLRGLRLAH
jgi:hypothetical protein